MEFLDKIKRGINWIYSNEDAVFEIILIIFIVGLFIRIIWSLL
jgi:hypothetical protein